MGKLDEIRARWEKATEGKWRLVDDGTIRAPATREALMRSDQMGDYRGPIICDMGAGPGKWNTEARNFAMPEARRNADFIAHSWEDIRWLVGEVERLGKELDKRDDDLDHASACFRNDPGCPRCSRIHFEYATRRAGNPTRVVAFGEDSCSDVSS